MFDRQGLQGAEQRWTLEKSLLGDNFQQSHPYNILIPTLSPVTSAHIYNISMLRCIFMDESIFKQNAWMWWSYCVKVTEWNYDISWPTRLWHILLNVYLYARRYLYCYIYLNLKEKRPAIYRSRLQREQGVTRIKPRIQSRDRNGIRCSYFWDCIHSYSGLYKFLHTTCYPTMALLTLFDALALPRTLVRSLCQ